MKNDISSISLYTCSHLEDNVGIYIKFAIRDENEELVRHNNMSFFPTEEDAKKALNEIINQKFEEVTQ